MNKIKIAEKIGDVLTTLGGIISILNLLIISFAKIIMRVCDMKQFLTVEVWGITMILIGLVFWKIADLLND